MPEDLNAMSVFVAVAEANGFRAAGLRLGVTASAVSQTLRKLEERLGVVLVQRTSRSVHLTEAGEQLFAAVRPALEEVRAAVAAVGERSNTPRGTLRLVVSTGTEPFLRDHVLAEFLAAYPEIRLDLDVTNGIRDIVAAGYDAGIRLGEVIDRDMIAVPLSGDVRLVVVGAPTYFARHGKPTHPRDLVAHACVNWHPTPDAPAYHWEFTEPASDGEPRGAGARRDAPPGGRDFAVSVPTRVLTTDPALVVRLTRAGVGLAMLYEDQVRDDVAAGTLVPVLEAFSAPFPGF
ncbi:MAG TPA: LysR family transcriptional regulator, partial [Gemmatirosa sp.]